MTELKPMKAPSTEVELDDLFYPCLASIKFDGIRCEIKKGKMLSSSMKEHPNKQLAIAFAKHLKDHSIVLDGELFDPDIEFRLHSGLCAAHDRDVGGLKFYCWENLPIEDWDLKNPVVPYSERLKALNKMKEDERFKIVKQTLCKNRADVDRFIAACAERGDEGAMFRDPEGLYKHGKATLKQAIIVKFKFWKDFDAQIVAVEEGWKNKEGIERTLDPTGHKKTVTSKLDKERSGSFGRYQVKVDIEGTPLMYIGGWKGLTDEERDVIWLNRELEVGKWLRFKAMAAGQKDLPRIPKSVEPRDDKEFEF